MMFNHLRTQTNYLLKYILLLILFSFLLQCGKDEVKKPIAKKKDKEKKAFIAQDEREIEKAKLLNIKSRKTFSHFYTKDKKISDKSYFVEEINFDKNGNMLIHKTFLSAGQIDLQWIYEYDDAGNLLSSRCLAGGVTKRSENIYTYDENGNEVEMKDYQRKTNNYNKIVTEYSDDGLKTKSTLFDHLDKIISKTEYSYVDRKLVSQTFFNNKSEQTAEINYQYDSLENIIEENKLVTDWRSRTKRYILDSLNNVITVDQIFYKRELEYDSSGNIINEQSFDGKGNAQMKIIHTYDENGLMIETIKYAGSGKPEIYVKYEYEYYK